MPQLPLSPVVAYGCRNCTTISNRLVIRSLLHNHHHSPPRAPAITTTPATLRFHSFNIPTDLCRVIIGNSLFFRMEVNLGPLVWRLCILLAFSNRLNCFANNTPPLCTSLMLSDLQNVDTTQERAFRFLQMERFWSGTSVNKSKEMVKHLQNYGIIRSEKIAQVMEAIDRALFVPGGSQAYVDSPMPIGYNATISAPHMHAMCLELLADNLKPGMHALDVGSGTGYLTACFGMMVGPQGRAVGVEHIPELVTSSVENIDKSAAAPLLKEGSLSVHVGDGRQGWPEFAPYDAIHVGAAAAEIPSALIEQLKPGGRMVIPVGNIFQDLKVIDKKLDGSLSVRSETSVRYVPLTSRDSQLRGF